MHSLKHNLGFKFDDYQSNFYFIVYCTSVLQSAKHLNEVANLRKVGDHDKIFVEDITIPDGPAIVHRSTVPQLDNWLNKPLVLPSCSHNPAAKCAPPDNS